VRLVVDRIVVHGVPDGSRPAAFEALLRAELKAAASGFATHAAPGGRREVAHVRSTAPAGSTPAAAVAATLGSLLGGGS
jgi:hypothetical protein